MNERRDLQDVPDAEINPAIARWLQSPPPAFAIGSLTDSHIFGMFERFQ